MEYRSLPFLPSYRPNPTSVATDRPDWQRNNNATIFNSTMLHYQIRRLEPGSNVFPTHPFRMLVRMIGGKSFSKKIG